MRQIITKGLYILLVEMIATYLIVTPVYALVSTTGYARVATSTALAVYQGAQRTAFTNAVAVSMAATTPVSVAVRLVTGPVGWASLGVSAAVTVAAMYYSASDITTQKTAALAAAPPLKVLSNGSGVQVPSTTPTLAVYYGPSSCVHPCAVGGVQYFYLDTAQPPTGCVLTAGGSNYTNPSWPGWQVSDSTISGACRTTYLHTSNGANGSQEIGFVPPSSLTLGEYESYTNTLPSTDPKSIEKHTVPVGEGVTPTAATNVTTLPATPAELPTTVKPAASVLPTDAVINPNAPASSAPQPVVTPATTTTTTTTTTTNPNGSVTKTDTTDPGSFSCQTGTHDVRTFGTVLQDHINVWQGSGLLSALNVLKTLTWPTTPPAYTLTSPTWGTHTIDFAPWAGMLTALRTIIIALASFVAYRIVFVGSK